MSDSKELFQFENTYAAELEELVLDWQPVEVPEPTLVAVNLALAAELGIDPDQLDSAEGAAVVAGNAVPATSRPVAMAYAGHQFGGYSPRLGDGRAVLLGEIIDPAGCRHDVHLKGSGRTPFARGGDGKAVLGPMLREFLLAEAMHALGVPTTRALAVAATGEEVVREQMVPGAILARVATSHLRVGTFEYAARLEDEPDLAKRLADYSIQRHYPQAGDADSPYLAFFEAVVDAQAKLVATWMQLGFIHGVLNTDNVTISGQGIDYGPCAFMDHFDPATVFSSIDRGGRYAYGQQPIVSTWNLTRLAETLVTLIDDDFDAAAEPLMALLNGFQERHNGYWLAGMRSKLGLSADEADESLVHELLKLLEVNRVDYTGTFRALSASLRGDDAALSSLFAAGDLASALEWQNRWSSQITADGRDLGVVADQMDSINPIYIPRNHLVEEALAAATDGDLSPFNTLLDVVTDPFNERDGFERFAEPGPDAFQQQFQTFCGT